jgi:dTDP-4-amino-4,6-dideoxygalactose transaminase
VILIDGLHWNKEKLRNIFSENNIETRYLWKPMHLQSLYKDYIFFGNNISGAFFDRGLVPSFWK